MNLFGWFRKVSPPPVAGPNGAARSEPAPTVANPATGAIPPTLSPAEVRRLLFDAVAAGDDARLEVLCLEHRDLILSHGPGWLEVPESFRSSRDAYRWYEEGLRAIAHFCRERLQDRSVAAASDATSPSPAARSN
jgi:hypothetical protein